jgi:tRNA U34 2-thiouridine synthase MnmA/TrmU
VTHVKLRYRSDPIPCTIETANCQLPTANLHHGFEGAAPGQTAVLLRHTTVVGWGTIADTSNTVPVLLPLAASTHV